MKQILFYLLRCAAALLVSAVPLRAAPPPLTVFLGERIGLVPQAPGLPEEALPAVTARAEKDAKSMFFVIDCDARNLHLPGGTAAPFRISLQIGAPEQGKGLAIETSGTRDPAGGDIKVTCSAGGQDLPEAPEAITASQSNRDDGTWRVNLKVASSLLDKHVSGESLAFGVQWRQLTGLDETGAGQYADRAGVALVNNGGKAVLEAREVHASDIAAMLSMLATAPNERCAARCLRRIHWNAIRDEALRGALVMALEHSDPSVRRAAAKTWLAWPNPGSPDLPVLQDKARAISPPAKP